ncbi:tyrosine-protein kinase family protein [Thalassospira alkalitolerans]|uniref:tyrosine-protein kinase family protein n=1 Tax=Thalassospira alkalitolerans TaxID=1293890 RepID=UPI000A1E9D2E|nr:AAA family ATPase [Thalassospira alkalitolerans]
MHVVTFYSFKGGVGRTQALVECGSHLSLAGKKVLVVDFDLEAPSLHHIFGSPACNGIVEFISQFVSTREVPIIQEFIQLCEIKNNISGEKSFISVMSAGCLSEDYGRRLEYINWRDLYQKHQGFMLVEDMRAQWRELKYDYVLVDSRTGHTDVGGICTRQLPDTLVAMAFPNYQNLDGLAGVVRDAQLEHARYERSAPPDVKLVLSRIPDCDDENGVLEKIEAKFSEKIDSNGTFYIHAYDSMDLLNNSIFSISRPRSQLSLEYRKLADAIRASNIEDREGVLIRLNEFELDNAGGFISEITEDIDWYWIDKIEEMYQDDIEVLKSIGFYLIQCSEFDRGGQFLEAANILGDTDVLLPLAISKMYNGHPREAADLAVMALDFEGTMQSVLSGLQIIFDSGEDKSVELSNKAGLENLDVSSWGKIMAKISPTSEVGRLNMCALINEIEKRFEFKEVDPDDLMRQMITSRMFSDAVRLFESLDDESRSLQVTYNYSIARWAMDGVPPVDLFEKISLEYDENTKNTANYHQCFGLVFGVLGNKRRARKCVNLAKDRARRSLGFRMLSTWSFLYVPSEIAEDHFEEFKRQLSQGRILPPIVTGVSALS